jgi:Flp pilus assembly protein TadG
MRLNRAPRAGTTVVECAIIYPVVFLFTLGLVIGAMGISRYQQLASLARQAARYASLHGEQYSKDTKNPAPTPAQIYDAAVVPNAVALDLSKLSYSITYDTSNKQYRTSVVVGQVVATANTVTVTLQYQWIPEAFLGGITLSSTSVATMLY